MRHFARWRTGIIALALIVHLAFSFLHYAERQADAAEYDALATELALHHTFGLSTDGETAVRPTARRMPLYPLLLAGIYRAAGIEQGLYGAPLVQALLMVCNVALTLAIARRFFDDATALLAGLLVCFYQGYLYLPTELLSENLAIPLLLLTLWLLTRPTRRRAPSLIAAFVTFGLLVLTRANALVLLPVLLVWTGRTLRGQRRRFIKLAALAACFVVTLAPWWLRNAIAFERFVPLTTSGGWNFYLGHNEAYARSPGLGQGTDYAIFDRLIVSGLTEPEADRELYARGLAYARAHPAETATNVFRKTEVTFSVTTQGTWNLIFVALICAGAFALAPGGGPPRRTAIAVALIGLGLTLWITQAAVILLRDEKGLAGVGVSFGLLALAALAGLAIAAGHSRAHWFLAVIYLTQLAACLVYIPLTRIRWSVDAIAITYAALAITTAAQRLFPSPNR